VAVSGVLGHQLASGSPPSSSAPRQLVIADPYDHTGTWYRGNLQVASARGIGRDLPSAIGQWYAAGGNDFLGISDVNTYTWISEYGSKKFTAVPVIDASYTFGDVLDIGDDQWHPASNLQQVVDWVRRDDGLPVLAAPLSSSKPIDPAVLTGLHGLFGLEIYDARLALSGQGDATAVWDRLLTSGKLVYAFAGDDALSIDDPAAGKAWLEVESAAPDLDSLMSSLRAGMFYATTGPRFTDIALNGLAISVGTSPGTTVRFIGRNGTLLEATAGPTASYRVRGTEGYVRIEAIADDGTRAWSQPLFLSWR
jgi:hypothetical protein